MSAPHELVLGMIIGTIDRAQERARESKGIPPITVEKIESGGGTPGHPPWRRITVWAFDGLRWTQLKITVEST